MNPAPPERRFSSGGILSKAVALRLALVAAIWLLLAGAGAWFLLLCPAKQLDVRAAEREADICEGFLAVEMARLRATALDWANWDDVEKYLQSTEGQFAVENVTQNALRNLDVDGMLLLRKDGSLQRREVTGPNKSLYMGSANFLERIAPLRAMAEEKGASATILGNAGHLYIVAAAPALGTDATGPSSGQVVIFTIVTDADLSKHPGIEGATVALFPTDAQPVAADADGDRTTWSGSTVLRSLKSADGAEAARLLVYHDDSHTSVANRAFLFFAVAGVLLAVLFYAAWAYVPARR